MTSIKKCIHIQNEISLVKKDLFLSSCYSFLTHHYQANTVRLVSKKLKEICENNLNKSFLKLENLIENDLNTTQNLREYFFNDNNETRWLAHDFMEMIQCSVN